MYGLFAKVFFYLISTIRIKLSKSEKKVNVGLQPGVYDTYTMHVMAQTKKHRGWITKLFIDIMTPNDKENWKLLY